MKKFGIILLTAVFALVLERVCARIAFDGIFMCSMHG